MAILGALTLGGCPPTPPDNGNDNQNGNNNGNDNSDGGVGLSTSFEFTDTTGEFVLGQGAGEVTFTGGEARTVGVPNLYHSGHHAWMISPGETGEISLQTPTFHLELFIRDQSEDTGGVLRLFDAGGEELAYIPSSHTEWVRVAWPGDIDINERVGRITLTNTGSSGLVAMDDFSCCGDDAGGNGGSDLPEPVEDPIPEGIGASPIRLRLTTVATDLTAPNWGMSPPGHPGRLAVADQDGTLWMIELATSEKSVLLDVSGRLVTLGIDGPGSFDERGLLGFAFDLDYAETGLFYTYTSEPPAGISDFSTIPAGEPPNHQSVILEWRVTNPMDAASVADPASARELMRIDQPQFNHNGGAMAFGPDGMLYIAVGDGGAADDQGFGHGPNGNGQSPEAALGKLLRIDPSGSNADNGKYGIPADNPLLERAGFLREIFAYGLRNPFRFSFDTDTGELWLADVGQNAIEEINVIEPGRNYGWNVKEGTFFFYPNGGLDGFVSGVPRSDAPEDLADPVAEYDHDEGIAAIGGFVYRGQAIPQLQGLYIFGDLLGRLFHLDANGEIREFTFEDRDGVNLSILGFAQDAAGEVYLLANGTGVPFESTGVVLRLDPAMNDN